MQNNLNIKVTADLNVTRSVAQINAEIKKIEGQLRYLKLTATLDKGKSTAEIQKQIATLNKQKKQLYVDLKLRQKDLKNQYKQIEKQNKMQLNVDTTSAQRNIANVGTTIKQTASETATLGFALKSALSNAGLVLSAQTALQLVRKAAREATEAVKEYDTYQTNLSVITGGTRAESDDIIADLADKSFEYKVDISELESATETLLRTGKSMEEIEHYLKDTVYLSKIGFQDATESAENLVTIGNAFEYNAEEMENVVDKLLALDTASNTVAGKLATALAKTAQNAKLAGLEIDQLGAIVSGLRDTTGKSEDEIATALNSMTARVYNVKLGKYEMELEDGTTEDITESLNNTERMLKTVGISLRDNKNQFKEIDEIINEIVPKWDEFTNVQQNSIASTFAGTYHRNTFISLIENWEKIGELTAISADSAGQAATKYSTYIDSIEAKSSALSTSMKELWNGLVTNEFVGNLTDATTGVIKFADEYRVLQNLLKSVTFYAFAKGLVSTKNSLLGIATDVKNVSTAFVQLETVQKSARGTELYKSNIKALGTTVSALSDKQIKLLLSTNQLSNSQKVAILHASGLSKKEAELKLQTLGLATTQKTATASTVSLSGSLKALWATISANPIMAVTMLFSGITMAISAYKQKVEEAREQAVESAEECNEQIKALQNLRTEYINIVESENTVSEKTEELNRWKQTLIETYGFEKDAIEQVNTAREEGLGLLDKEILKNQINAAETWLTDNKDAYDEAKSVLTTQDTSRQRVKNTVMSIAKDELDDYSDNFDDIIKQLSIKNPTKDNPLAQINIKGGTTLEQLENLNAVLNDITSIKVSKGLNKAEEKLYDALLKKQKEYKKIVTDDMVDIFENGKKYTEMLQVYNFETTEGINFENVTQDNYKTFRDEFLTSLGFGLKKDSTDFSLDIEQTLLEMLPDLEKSYRGIEDIVVESAEATVDAGNTIATANEETAKSFDDIQKAYDELAKSASAYTKNQKTVTEAIEEQAKYGKLSATTIQSLVEAGYSQALVTDKETNAVTLNVDAYNKLNAEKKQLLIYEAKQQKADIEKKYRDEQSAISDLTIEMRYANEERRKAIALELAQHGQNMADYADMIDGINSNIVSLDAPSDYGSSGNSKPTSVTNFEKELARKQHLINTGKMREDEAYYDWLEQAAYTAYSGLADYEDELYKYQEQVYKGRQQLAENYFNERVNELAEYAEKVEKTSVTSDGTKLTSQEKWREIADIYHEIQNEIAQRINDIVEIGADSNKELLDELNKQYEEYAEKISDTFRSAVEEEEDLVNAQKDKYSDLYDERIDKIKEQQETMEKAVNTEIEAIDEKIKHLQKANDEENAALEIEKARQELRKAEQHTRKVYGADGNITYEQDKVAIAEARKNLDELLMEQQITALENEKSVLESIRDTETEGYNKLIKSLESEKEQGEKQFDILLQVLDNYLNPNDSTSNVDVWSELAKTEGAKYSDGVWRDKDNNVIDIDKMLNSSNVPQIMRTIDIDAWLKKLKASPEFIQGVQSGDSNAVTAKLTDSINANANKQWNDQHKPDFSASRDDYKINNQSQIINNTIGDVHVHNPVSNSNDLAKELALNLTNAFQRQMYTNLKKY